MNKIHEGSASTVGTTGTTGSVDQKAVSSGLTTGIILLLVGLSCLAATSFYTLKNYRRDCARMSGLYDTEMNEK